MRALIDLTVPFANIYYSTYLTEPSPAGDITIASDGIATVDHMSLERLLTEMKDVGPKGELLVATHSGPEGFLMTLMLGGKASLKFSVMGKILQIAEGIRQHEALRSLAPAQRAAGWSKWVKEFDPLFKLEPGFETNPDWQKVFEDSFTSWMEVQATPVLHLPHGATSLRSLLDLLNDVRKLGFARLEFRACELGADSNALKQVAEFFQVKTVVAPKKVQTFYGSFVKTQINFVADAKKFDAAFKRMGGRRFADSLGILMMVHGLRILARDEDALKAFINKYISSTYKGKVLPFVVGGVNSVGKTTTRYVFPLEMDYEKLIDRFDA